MTSITFISENDFSAYNPWFEMSIRNRFNRFTDSNTFRNAVDCRFNERFSTEFRRSCCDTDEFRSLLRKLSEKTSECQIQIENETKKAVNKIIEQEPVFADLKQNIYIGAVARVDEIVNREKAKREERIKNLEKTIQNIENAQGQLFGLGLCGGIIGTLLYLKH